MRFAGRACVAAGAMAYLPGAGEAGQAGKTRQEVLAARRFELMQRRATAARVESGEPGFPRGFAAEPIFRYSDPTRGYVAAAVWKLGDEGRPKALLASELRRAVEGVPCLSYEFSSLTATPFSVRSGDMDWSPSGTPFDLKPIPRAQAPGASPPQRLRQLREIARRFACRETVDDEPYELRLLPTPVDRYTPSKVDRADGAVFFFTLGTNPEVVLLIESDGEGWSYAAGRLTGAQSVALTLDGAIAWGGPAPRKARGSSFAASISPVDIPGIAPDGTDLPE